MSMNLWIQELEFWEACEYDTLKIIQQDNWDTECTASLASYNDFLFYIYKFTDFIFSEVIFCLDNVLVAP